MTEQKPRRQIATVSFVVEANPGREVPTREVLTDNLTGWAPDSGDYWVPDVQSCTIEDLPRTATDIVDEAIANLDDAYYLTYIHYDDEISLDQIEEVFQTGADTSVGDYLGNRQRDGLWEAIKEVLDDDDERDIIVDDPDQRDRLEEAILDRDKSSGFADLVRNTGKVLLRFMVNPDGSLDETDVEGEVWTLTEEEVAAKAVELAGKLGLDLDAGTNRAEMVELVSECGSWCLLHVIWYGELADLLEASFDDTIEGRTISWDNPNVMLLNGWSGQGHTVKVTGTVTLPFNRESIHVDAAPSAPGYSWTAVAGPSLSYYEAEATITMPDPGPGPWHCKRCDGQIVGGWEIGWTHAGPAEQGHGATADADHPAAPKPKPNSPSDGGL